MHLNILYSHVGMIDYPRGVFYRSIGLAQELSRRGHNVTFLATQQDEFVFPWKTEDRVGVRVVSFPSVLPRKVRRLGYAVLPILLRIIYVINYNYDIYHCDHHRPTSFFCALVGRFFKGGKVIVEWMDFMGKGSQYDNKSLAWKSTVGPLDNYYEIKSKTMADGVVVISEYLKQKTLEVGVGEDKVVKIWGASDVQDIAFVENKEELRTQLGLPVNKFVVNLANMSDIDINHYYSIIVRFLKNLGKSRSITVMKTGPESSTLKKIGNTLNIDIFQFGSVSYERYCQLLSISDCFMLFQEESLREISRWPNVIGDFLAAGNPTLLQPAGDAQICAETYPEAFVCISSPSQINAKKVNELISKTSTSNRQKIRRLATNKFSWEKRGETLENFYKRIGSI